jgi:hypothetical protein
MMPMISMVSESLRTPARLPLLAQVKLAEPDLLLDFPAQPPAWFFLGAGALLIAVVLLRVRLRSRYSGKERTEPECTPAPPHEEALSELASLESEIPQDDLDEDFFHVSLSRIVRRYLFGRYDLAALEMASEEAVGALEGYGIGADQRGLLQSVLDRCDRIKFGRRRAGADAARETLGQARRFVEETADPLEHDGGVP